MWWDLDTIEATVTRQFVCSHLLPEEIERLDQPLGFGDGLTDGTYWEWIDEKAKRLFLILVDLGVPDQIFGVIDDSWDDEDLPIARDQVECLALTPAKDEKFERRFYYRQFYYLVKLLQKAEHVDYEDFEVVPLDVVDRKQGLAVNHSTDKVVLPNHPGVQFCRRRIPLGSGPGCIGYEDFLYEVNSIRNIQNEHLVSYFASYVHQGYGYVLFTPVSDFGLKSFLATTPTTFKSLEKKTRRELVLNWIHCLVDTICFLHNRGLSHGNIKPSTVLFTNENHIFFSDFSRLNAELLASLSDKTSFDKESYDYAAPEQWFRPTSSQTRPVSGQLSPILRKPTLTSLSASPDNTTFSISRSNSDYSANSPAAMMHAPTPHLNPQAADIFSLGCVILELLSFLMKKPTRSFATHRAAKHKSPGRGGAVLDSSFHKNLGQVESWMTSLAREAAKKGRDDALFRGVAPMLHVVERMLALHPSERPAAHDVQTRMYEILHDVCGVAEPHCVHQYGGWDFGIGNLKLRAKREARDDNAEAMSIVTRRSSGSARGSIVGSIAQSVAGSSSSGGSIQEQPAAPLSPRLKQSEIGSGLQAIQKLRVRTDSSRQWQPPAVGVGY
ncbi:protein kinase [Coniochaeta ligniaria NRRL 30616]|uniref:Protein kinase n=1 Tax=Coniochaeta ligniaria NRRL 30616 TaxID=1408157 RepID=A0A1J7IJA3_9PEZI|nr:protein kinase [Coniochaeta ligniaria NRRL 30616]